MTIQSIIRVNDILSLFSIDNPRWGVSEIANALGLAKTTVSSLMKVEIKISADGAYLYEYHLYFQEKLDKGQQLLELIVSDPSRSSTTQLNRSMV